MMHCGRYLKLLKSKKGRLASQPSERLIAAAEFNRRDAELYLPIYIEPDMMEALRKFSKNKGVDVETIVNEWIKKDISIVETITK